MVEIICKCGCGKKKLVRQADINRGWGKFASKSCKARHQERRTGQYSSYLHREKRKFDPESTFHPFEPYSLEQW